MWGLFKGQMFGLQLRAGDRMSALLTICTGSSTAWGPGCWSNGEWKTEAPWSYSQGHEGFVDGVAGSEGA